MKTVAHFQKDDFGLFEIIDDRNGETVKRGIKSVSKAAAYVAYYNEEIEKADLAWDLLDAKGVSA